MDQLTKEQIAAGAADMEAIMRKEIEERNGKLKDWKKKDFEFGLLLGKGTFGRVFLAREKLTKFMVAIKILRKDEITRNRLQDQVMREISIQNLLEHPNILKMYTYFHDCKNIYFVLEYNGGCDLYEILQEQVNKRFTERKAAKYIYQVADALNYCQSMSIIHRDLKPENLLLDINDNIKLMDFGLSVQDTSNFRKTVCGTKFYMPPEMVENKEYTAFVDNWCLGILCYELLVGIPPFTSENSSGINNITLNVEMKLPGYLSSHSKNLISSLLRKDPCLRISLQEVMEHKWIKLNYIRH